MSAASRQAPWAAEANAQQLVIFRGVGVVFGLIFGGLGFAIAEMDVLPGVVRPAFPFIFGPACGYAIYRMCGVVVVGISHLVEHALQPSGNSTPYTPQLSAHQALVASDDLTEAFAAYERTMAQEPSNVEARRQAIELHLRQGDPHRAESLCLELRRLPGDDRAVELYATQRLVDLYLGSLGDPGRALVELRRLSERFAGTPEARGALAALARLKAESRDPSSRGA